MIPPIHPFPARMAPEIATTRLKDLPKGSTIVDPMMGSGTVLRHAVQHGHYAVGVDMDPLAVLMSRVWSTSICDEKISQAQDVLLAMLPKPGSDHVSLPWIDDDEETEKFVSFWFGARQIAALRQLAFVIHNYGSINAETAQIADVFRIALSRIIITKNKGASLANDVSHSRPHRVMTSSDFDVIASFIKSLTQVRRRLCITPQNTRLVVHLGDARNLSEIGEGTADLILTSPPYLNAIDYMRGHKLSLVWLGHKLSELRGIRSETIGAERKASSVLDSNAVAVQQSMVNIDALERRHGAMVQRYSSDLIKMMSEIARVLKPGGEAILVVGNSCIRETFVHNSVGVTRAAELAGFRLSNDFLRELPSNNRYLPTPKLNDTALGKRMRTESVLTFEHAA